ncbi:GlsB/YeaQ/YmgE family stress response membrane protein [Gymnodinialimonas sp. 2305UL16-5]
MSIIWTIIIGFIAGVIAKFITPGDNEPSGFVLTTLLGVAGAFVAQFIFDALGLFQGSEGVGLIGSVFGAVLVLLIWGFLRRRAQ